MTEDSRGIVLTFIWSSLERSAASFSRINSFSWATSCSVWESRSAISSTAISPPAAAAAAAARGEPGPWGETGKKVCYRPQTRTASLKAALNAHPHWTQNNTPAAWMSWLVWERVRGCFIWSWSGVLCQCVLIKVCVRWEALGQTTTGLQKEYKTKVVTLWFPERGSEMRQRVSRETTFLLG